MRARYSICLSFHVLTIPSKLVNMFWCFMVALGVYDLSHAPFAGTVSVELTQMIFGSTSVAGRLLTYLQSPERTWRDFLCTLISCHSLFQILHLFLMTLITVDWLFAWLETWQLVHTSFSIVHNSCLLNYTFETVNFYFYFYFFGG